MKGIILVAGYATRLYPFTLNMPKALLPIGGKPIIDYIYEEMSTISVMDEVIVVTNHKFYEHFSKWAAGKSLLTVRVLDDGTSSEETRKGSIGDTYFAISELNIDDDLMVAVGDNFFTFKLIDYYNYYVGMDRDCICVKEIADAEKLHKVGVCLLDSNMRVIDFEEKPANPKSNLAVYGTYIYKRNTVELFERYLREGNNPDAPGYFVEWLYKHRDLRAFLFSGECYDIGTPELYTEVLKIFPN